MSADITKPPVGALTDGEVAALKAWAAEACKAAVLADREARGHHDLLEATKGLLSVAPAKAPAAGLIVGIEKRHADAIAAARAAIAKATGEAA